MNGRQVLGALYKDTATRNIPVLMVTGTDLEEPARSALYLNKNLISIYRKPACFEDILRKIGSIYDTPTAPVQAVTRNKEGILCEY